MRLFTVFLLTVYFYGVLATYTYDCSSVKCAIPDCDTCQCRKPEGSCCTICVARECKDVGGIVNGYITKSNGNALGSIASCLCSYGYRLKRRVDVICRDDGYWHPYHDSSSEDSSSTGSSDSSNRYSDSSDRYSGSSDRYSGSSDRSHDSVSSDRYSGSYDLSSGGVSWSGSPPDSDDICVLEQGESVSSSERSSSGEYVNGDATSSEDNDESSDQSGSDTSKTSSSKSSDQSGSNTSKTSSSKSSDQSGSNTSHTFGSKSSDQSGSDASNSSGSKPSDQSGSDSSSTSGSKSSSRSSSKSFGSSGSSSSHAMCINGSVCAGIAGLPCNDERTTCVLIDDPEIISDPLGMCCFKTFEGRCFYKDRIYRAGAVFKDRCNVCKCHKRKVKCTKKKCPPTCTHNGKIYQSGDRFKDKCNSCTCNDGIVACTRIACPKPCNYKGKVYKSGHSCKDSCNTCTCNNGVEVCTNLICVDKGSGEDCGWSGIETPCTHNTITYDSGDKFDVECNTCVCRNGQVICTKRACGPKSGVCPPLPEYGTCAEACANDYDCTGDEKCCSNGCGHACMTPLPKSEFPCTHNGHDYASGSKFKDDCNECTCTNGNIDCTDAVCPKPCYYNNRWYDDDKSFDKDCNTCACSNGRIACTEMYCPQPCTYNGKSYRHGYSFKDDCNTCECNDGTMTCTKMGCKPRCIYYDNQYTCGDIFPAGDGCNTCTCVNGQVACTTMTCGCEWEGYFVKEGESIQTDPCTSGECRDGELIWRILDCAPPPEYCPNGGYPTKDPDQCCATCPPGY